LYIEQVQFDKAEQNLKRALEIRLKAYGENHTRVAQTYKHLLTLYELQVSGGRREERRIRGNGGRGKSRRALEIRLKAYGEPYEGCSDIQALVDLVRVAGKRRGIEEEEAMRERRVLEKTTRVADLELQVSGGWEREEEGKSQPRSIGEMGRSLLRRRESIVHRREGVISQR
jgi:hypothetical protein